MRERQIKITMRDHFTPVRIAIVKKPSETSVGKDADKRELFDTTVGM